MSNTIHADLFAGIGGFSRARERLDGSETTQVVEDGPDAQAVLRTAKFLAGLIQNIKDFSPLPCIGTSIAESKPELTIPAPASGSKPSESSSSR